MALIKCIECKKEISDTAEICPSCGCNIYKSILIAKAKAEDEKRKKKKEREERLKFYFLFALFIWMVKSCG